jgi:hypothetical protein
VERVLDICVAKEEMMNSFIFLFVGEDQTSSGETRNSNDEMESMRRERESSPDSHSHTESKRRHFLMNGERTMGFFWLGAKVRGKFAVREEQKQLKRLSSINQWTLSLVLSPQVNDDETI